MRRGGLVAARRDGKFVFYRLADDAVLDLVAALRRVAETQSAEVERVVRSYFANRDCLEPVARAELNGAGWRQVGLSQGERGWSGSEQRT